MSFILDALKKSELERQRQSVPGLMDAPVRARRNRLPKWALVLGVLLGVNLAVLTVILVKRGAPSMQAPAHALRAAPRHDAETSRQAPATAAGAAPSAGATSSSGAAPSDAASADRPFSPMDQAPVYAPEIPVVSDPSRPSNAVSAPRAAALRSSGEPAARRSDPLLTPSEPPESQEVLPTISEISLAESQALPELHLDVHVFATRPAERFVYINMRKYHEGSVLQEGPLVEHIRRDGVALNYRGLRFLLPRTP